MSQSRSASPGRPSPRGAIGAACTIVACGLLFTAGPHALAPSPTGAAHGSGGLDLGCPERPLVLPVGSLPDGVRIGVPTVVAFTARIVGFASAPDLLALRRLDGGATVGTLHDDGSGGDLEPGDGIYSGRVLIDEAREGAVQFRAVVPDAGDAPGDEVFTVVVTCDPTTLRPSEASTRVTDAGTGQSFLPDELLVTFAAGTPCARRRQIVARVGGAIAGSHPGLGIHQVIVPNARRAPETVLAAIDTLRAERDVVDVTPNIVGASHAVRPNDPRFVAQYALRRIRADRAWSVTRGGPIVAVVDTGVDDEHPDLIGRVANGHDYVNGDDDPDDDHGHGTAIAGIVAARGNNRIAIAGVAWDSRILAIKVTDQDNALTAANAAAAVEEAVTSGARIVNLSWGLPTDVPVLRRAVAGAVARGALVVAAAGNSGAATTFYPCAYASVLCVGSTTPTDARAEESTYGPQVDLAAPGLSILSTAAGGGVIAATGTSFAAPHVSGAAAMVWGRFPSLPAAAIRARLERTARPLPGQQLGAGRVDVFAAVRGNGRE